MKGDLLVSWVDENADDAKGQGVFRVQQVVHHGGNASAPLVNV